MDRSRFSLAFEHNGESIAVSIESPIPSVSESMGNGAVEVTYDPEAVRAVIDRLASAAEAALAQ